MNIEARRMRIAIDILGKCLNQEILWLKKDIVDAILELAQYAYSNIKERIKAEAAINASVFLLYRRGATALSCCKEAVDKIAAEND